MKKTIISIAAAAICAVAISAQAFAEDITTDTSIYADNTVKISASGEKTLLDSFNAKIKTDTIMPVYSASIYDYVKDGKFTFVNDTRGDLLVYIADCVDEKGNYAGTVRFCADGIREFAPRDDEAKAADFHKKVDGISEFMKENNMDTNITEAKIALIEGIGYVYYISNGTTELLAPVVAMGEGAEFFNYENGSVTVVDEDFKAAAIERVEELNKWLTYSGNPLTGGDTVPGDGNPVTGGTGMAIAGAGALAACAVGITLLKKKKD